MRVIQGGRNAKQLEPVQQALAEFQRIKLIDVEYIDINTVKMQHLTIQSIVQLLLSSDVHLIITHMHQGIMELLRWNMTDLVLELQLLYSHPGYPTGRSLEDPIFLQDKFKYQSQFIPSHRLCELSRHRTPERLSYNYCLLR